MFDRSCNPSSRVACTGPDYDFGANPILGMIDGKPIVADGDKGAAFHVLVMQTKADSYAALVNVAAMGNSGTPTCAVSGLRRVVPNDPDNSLLVTKPAARACRQELH